MGKLALKMKKIDKKTKRKLINKIDRLVCNLENDNPAFYNEYFDLKDRFYKKIEETLIEESAFPEILVDENQITRLDPEDK